MPKVFPCFSPSDKGLALELAAYLERGMGVEVLLEEGEMFPGGDLISKVQEGLSADVVLVLLSPASVPGRWPLDRWKSVFWEQAAEVGTAVATLLCGDCKFPDLLRRKNFFDLRLGRLEAFRAIKRWLLTRWPIAQEAPFVPGRQPHFSGRAAELESLCSLLADQPGMVVVSNGVPGSGKTCLALEFARRYREDFDAVLWLTCGNRSATALAGDLATQMGTKLDRDLESNLNELRRLCARHRCLLILDDAPSSIAAAFVPRGRTSLLITTRDEGLADAISATPFPLITFSGRDPVELEESIRKLEGDQRRLLFAMCAAPASGFHLEVAARAAGAVPEEAGAIAARLLTAGLILHLDENSQRFLIPTAVREAVRAFEEQDSGARHHARTVSDLFDAQTSTNGDLTPYWSDLQAAFGWAQRSAADASGWDLACSLARRGVAWARAHDRIAEAFEILQSWSSEAERRCDRRILEDCAWEQIWILEHWDRPAEARLLDDFRRREYADQMAFDFG